MPLTFDERVAIVERLTAAAKESPRRYRLRVIAWICLGYAIVGTLLVAALALSVGVMALIVTFRGWLLLKFGWIPVIYAWVLGRALFVRMKPPTGRVLLRREAPKLFAIIDEIRARLRVARLDGVLVTPEMNAMVVETPRFGGIFGWRRHLLIGVPLMVTHSPEEMKAVLAHELGHLSGRHGRIAAWSWRVRLTWSALVASADLRRAERSLQSLMHWYAERLMLVTLVLARQHEYAADAAAAELTSRETAARTLAWLSVASQLLDQRYWNPLFERIATEPHAPAHPLHDLMQRRAEILAPPFDDVLAAALERNTAIDDTHPALRARLEHLGVIEPALGLAANCAADEFLGRTAANIVAECDRDWRTTIGPQWEERHRALVVANQQLEDDVLPEHADEETLHRRAEALVNLGRDSDALPLYETLLARDAKDARAAFQIGRILVQRGDLAGIDHLSNAARDWRLISASCELAYSALREKGREKEAHAWAERYEQQQAALASAQRESISLSVHDDLARSALAEEIQQQILEQCRKARWVGKVWIGRKNLTALPTSVDFVAVRGKMLRFSGGKRIGKLAQSLTVDVPLTVFAVQSGSLMRRLDAIGARRFLK